MSFNYLINPLDSSKEYDETNLQIKNSILYNGKLRNDYDSQGIFAATSASEEEFRFSNCESFNSNFEEQKVQFSEKLKVLLKNGGNKNQKQRLSDPYKFCEIDSQSSESMKTLKSSNFIERASLGSEKIHNATAPQSIMHFRSGRPPPSANESAEEKDCNGDIISKLNKNVKLASKTAVPIYTMDDSVITKLNQTAFKKLKGDEFDPLNKLSNVKNGRTLPSVQLPAENKPLLNKLLGKSKFSNSKPINVNSSLKGSRNALGKPFGFSQLQVQKHGNSKLDKKGMENKQKNFLKGKSLLNQLQKTALLNRPIGQGAKKNLSRAQFFGAVRASQKEPEGAIGLNSAGKSVNRKSLLEESLLGIKKYGVDKDLSSKNPLHSKSVVGDFTKSEDAKSVVETGSTTVLTTPKSRTEALDRGKHESLQRIWNIRNKLKGLKRDHHHFGLSLNEGDFEENVHSECLLFQNYWFSVCNDSDSASNSNRRRDTKLSQLKVELRHKIKQLQWRYKDEYRDRVVQLLVESARKQPNLTAFLIRLENSKFNNRRRVSRVKPFNLLKPELCAFTNPESGQKCGERAMPCVKFCQQHVACSNDQLLFTACEARRSDNTTCRAAVLNQNWENPLCLRHKRLENISELPKKMTNSKPLSRPPQPRKRSRSSTGCIGRSGRSRKRKRSTQKDKKEGSSDAIATRIACASNNFDFVDKRHMEELDPLKRPHTLTKITPQMISKCDVDESQEVEVGEEVLAMAADLPLELATQATKLLEEHDFTNVLNHIPADAFNDLFTEDKEEYEPTPQETEELERALEAVDKDVKSLEKLSQTQGILDTLLDEQTIAQTLAQLPEVTANLEVPQTLVPVFYQNGFSNINQLEQTLQDVNKSLTQTVLLNQGTEGLSNHFVNNLAIPNHADVLQS